MFSSVTLRSVNIYPIVMCCTEWTDWMGTLSYAHNCCSRKEGNKVQHLWAPCSRRLGEELDWTQGITHATAFLCYGQVAPPTSSCVIDLSGMNIGVFSRWRKSALCHNHVLYLVSLLLGTAVTCINKRFEGIMWTNNLKPIHKESCLLHHWMNEPFERFEWKTFTTTCWQI